MKNLFVLAAYLFSTTLLAQQVEPIQVKEYQLSNGLTVMLTENHNTPKVYGMVAVKAGGKNDPKDATGIAHYLEHMLFKGTQEMGTIDYQREKPYLDKINELYEQLGKTTDEEAREGIQKQINEQAVKAGEYAIANDMDKLLSKMGSTGVNAYTTEDYTAYHNTFPSNQIEKWLDIYSHRFEKPVFRLFQSELETVYEEKNRSMDDAFGQVFEQLTKNIYKVHPYGQQTVLGSIEHLKNPSLEKMYAYYDTYYVANNMVLSLSGDFDIDTVMPMIEAKFGDWKRGVVPEFPTYEEQDFNQREFVEKKLTPIKLGILAYRTPKNGHPDALPFELASLILSNYEMTGYLDKLGDDGKLMFAGAQELSNNDYSSLMVFFVPKVVGQKLETVEALILSEIQKLKNGDFSDEFFAAIKLNKQKEIDQQWESNYSRVNYMVQAFMQDKSWNEYYQNFGTIQDLTKQDVVAVANKYFTDNFLCFYSKMGFPKKQKLDKPSFEPVIAKNESKSKFSVHLDSIKSTTSTPRFVDFQKDITTTQINDRFTVKQVENPFNEVFDLSISYGVGKFKMPILGPMASYLSLIGTNDKTVTVLKENYHALGASYSFQVTEDQFIIHLSGLESQLEPVLALTQEMISNFKIDESKVKKMVEEIKTENKLNRSQPSFISSSLNEYVIHGDQAPSMRELTKSELKKLDGQQLMDAFEIVKTYQTDIQFVGNKDADKVASLCKKYLSGESELLAKEEKVILDRSLASTTKFYVINRKKSVQSQIVFNMEGSPRTNDEIPYVNAFNSYFGGDMSSLVFQEIREFRSLAYSAYGNYRQSPKEGKNARFIGYIGCQADKTNEAMDAMLMLINDMPEKSERMDGIRSSLIEKSKTAKPNFRSLIDRVEDWQMAGYSSDPNQLYLPMYEKLQFEDIVSFYEKQIQNHPLTITIVGDVKRFDLDALKKYGEVIMVKESNIYVN